MMTRSQLFMLPTLICGFAPNDYHSISSLSRNHHKPISILSAAINSNEDGDSNRGTLSDNSLYGPTSRFSSPDAFTESQISKIFGNCVPLSLAGRCKTNSNVDMIFLSSMEEGRIISESYIKCLQSDDDDTQHEEIDISALPIPIASSLSASAMKLLSHSYTSVPLSKSVLLSLNALLVNRDGGLFDNLPWSTWSVDPDMKERDAANNVVDTKYAMGKRVAYQRFMGKDWQGRSISLTNMAKRLRYMLEADEESKKDSGSDDNTMLSLSQRLLELEITEAAMFMAECEKNLAIANASENDDQYEVEQLEKARARLQLAETSLGELGGTTTDNQSKSQSLVLSILDKLSEQENPPPYRGAIGYPAKLDSKKEMFEDSVLPYSSPYELLNEIISEQLNSEVIGCVLEQCSLLEGNLVVGGSLLLKRKGVERTATLAGETVSYSDDDDDYGNEGVLPRSMYVVECFSDEAIGFAMTSRLPILVQREIYERAATKDVELDVMQASNVRNETKSAESLSYLNRIPVIRLFDDIADLTTQVEGERVLSKSQSRFIRIPLTTNPSPFDGPNQSSSASNGPVFSTFNPVASLDEFDTLSEDDKVRLLLKLESFKGALPRPRAVKSDPTLLDNMLVPLIDESVRRQYQIRDAERRGDFKEANALREEISPRQRALEEAQAAREAGLEERALQLEEEAELYKALRADVTQDEGSYSRFLDRDDWYERETKARIKRLDKKKFGSLLDGIDLP
mmetsp:Transcript_10667/g.18166  ORF Transcript_10667/g.18166 Transcript_10667/m.18166 type:complete len:741 (-) Transcript_10667:1623-3845(-)